MKEASLLWGRLGASRDEAADKLSNERKDLVSKWFEHPWNYLSGVDTTTRTPEFPDGRPIYWTTDERDDKLPIKPFPTHIKYDGERGYLRETVELLYTEPLLLFDKCRQMIISTTALGVIDWWCRAMPSRRWLLSKSKEDEAKKMLKEKVRAPHKRLPEWFRQISPQLPRPADQVIYAATDSAIMAVAQNVATSEARGGTNTGVLVDEACFQENTQEIIAAVRPAAGRIWLISTPYLGTFGGREFKKIEDEGRQPDE